MLTVGPVLCPVAIHTLETLSQIPTQHIVFREIIGSIRVSLIGVSQVSSGPQRALPTVLPNAQSAVSAQLAVFASAPVVAADADRLLVVLALARDTQAHAGHGTAPCFGNCDIAFFTVFEALATWQAGTGSRDSILDGCVDLVLHCTVFCETASHNQRC